MNNRRCDSCKWLAVYRTEDGDHEGEYCKKDYEWGDYKPYSNKDYHYWGGDGCPCYKESV
jgi:hypothetical protein